VAADEELYRRWAEGDRSAGQRLVDRYLAAISRFFANKAVREVDVEDLVSTTFERCARALGGFRADSSFRTYLFGIAHNVLREHVKRASRDVEVDLGTTSLRDLGPSPSSVVALAEERALLLAALRAVPIETQIVLELSHFEGLGRAEIAEILGVPPGTVASRLRRGRARLEEALRMLSGSPRQLEATLQGLERWMEEIGRAIDDAGSE